MKMKRTFGVCCHYLGTSKIDGRRRRVYPLANLFLSPEPSVLGSGLPEKSVYGVRFGGGMRRLLATLLTVNLVLLSHTADACGDKLLILGRPLRMNDRPAAVLAYAPIGSLLESVLNGPQWAAAITKSKHRVRVVQIPELLVRILNTQQFDVILISSMDASALRARLATTSSPAVFVAVVDSNSRDALRNAEKEYGVAMKGMAKSGDYLSAIGRAVDLHDRRVQAAMREKKNQRKSL